MSFTLDFSDQGIPLEGNGMLTFYDQITLAVGNHVVLDTTGDVRAGAADALQVKGVQRSAILDEKTCEYCMAQDGITFDLREPEGMALWEENPVPFHEFCRCEDVFTFEDEDGDFPNNNQDYEQVFNERFNSMFPELAAMTPAEMEAALAKAGHAKPGSDAEDDVVDESVTKAAKAGVGRLAKNTELWDDYEDFDLPF